MNPEEQQEKLDYAMAIVERYFDTDITNADAAMDVLLDNNVDPAIAADLVASMYPEEQES